MSHDVHLGRTAVAIARTCRAGGDPYDLLESVGELVRRAVPFDGAGWYTFDPGTLLFTRAFVDALPAKTCGSFFDHEMGEDDPLRFRSLAALGKRAAGRHHATGGRPERSSLWRDVFEPYGYIDELRALFGSGGRYWGGVTLWRAKGEPPFNAQEVSFLADVAPIVGAALRNATVFSIEAEGSEPAGCPVLLLDDRGKLVDATEAGLRWLDQATAGPPGKEFHGLLAYLRALAAQTGAGKPATMRLRTVDRGWDTIQASSLTAGGTAVVVHPSQPNELADMLVTAYGLTDREVELFGLICRGLSSDEMAAQLIVSPHTVRDHVKHVFSKVGVTTRGELVAKLFFAHCLEPLHTKARHRVG